MNTRPDPFWLLLLAPFGSISLGYSNGTTTSYQYDNASRLTSITYNGSNGVNEALSFSYDAAKNVLSLNRASGIATLVPDAITSATYDAANQQTQMSGTAL